MKKISVVLFSFCLTFAFGQKVSDYKYIAVPEKFKDFEKEPYGLESILSKNLVSKKYIVLSSDKNKWSAETGNPCNILNVEVLNTSSFLKNKVTVQFKDCDGKIVSESKGSSSIKEFETGYPDALKNALTVIPISNPSINLAAVENTKHLEHTKEKPAKKQDKEASATIFKTSTATKFTNGKVNLQKIQLDENQFILADANSSVPYATFKATAKEDVFRVKLSTGESTLGYLENGNIIIEIPQENGDFTKEVFVGK